MLGHEPPCIACAEAMPALHCALLCDQKFLTRPLQALNMDGFGDEQQDAVITKLQALPTVAHVEHAIAWLLDLAKV